MQNQYMVLNLSLIMYIVWAIFMKIIKIMEIWGIYLHSHLNRILVSTLKSSEKGFSTYFTNCSTFCFRKSTSQSKWKYIRVKCLKIKLAIKICKVSLKKIFCNWLKMQQNLYLEDKSKFHSTLQLCATFG